MKQLKNCKPPDHISKVNARVVAKLKFYEELMWVLQQQPCYMASLSACGLNGETAVTFNNIVNCVYAELEDPRTLHLFMAMLKLMIDKEVELVKDLDELFPVDAPLVYSVFSGFALKPHHYQEVVTVPTSDLLAISNLLRSFGPKVRQADDDPVVMTCEKIGQWEDDMINEVKEE